jgi:hypothetical protein
MKITQQQVVSLSLGILVVGDIILAIALMILQKREGAAIAGMSALVTGALLTVHLRGWRHAASVFLIFSSVLTGSAMNIVLVDGQASIPLPLIFPPVLGLALVGARGIIVSASLSLGVYVVRGAPVRLHRRSGSHRHLCHAHSPYPGGARSAEHRSAARRRKPASAQKRRRRTSRRRRMRWKPPMLRSRRNWKSNAACSTWLRRSKPPLSHFPRVSCLRRLSVISIVVVRQR